MSSQKPTHFGLTVQRSSFPEWYLQVLHHSEFLDPISFRGFSILRTSPMFIWRTIQEYFNKEIKELGVNEFYFPMVASESDLRKESDHIDSFMPEVAWITKSGDRDITPLAIRPTSEAIVYPFFKQAIRTHRDLPFKINQWCNILRWEVRSTVPLIRGREFLWQEGHCAYETKEECEIEVVKVMNLYEKLYKDLLAVPVVSGRKTEYEKFGGAEYTLSNETFIKESGRAVQAATSHNLGTNFAKMFDVKVTDYVHQSSWGITTRSIGIAVMMHGDNIGLVLPPRVAYFQVVIIPCGKVCDELKAYINAIVEDLKEIRVHVDWRDNVTAGYKFNYWEIRGIPLRFEIGKKDMAQKEFVMVARNKMTKVTCRRDGIVEIITNKLNEIHDEMYEKARKELYDSIILIKNYDEFLPTLNNKNLILMAWCGKGECLNKIKKDSEEINFANEVIVTGAKTLCIPFGMQENMDERCLRCGEKSINNTLFGRSY